MKELKVWNGRGYILNARKFPEYYKQFRSVSMYICAYSKADASRLINEFNGHQNPTNYNSEITVYFSPCWGIHMEGIEKERGIWIKGDNFVDPQPPQRII